MKKELEAENALVISFLALRKAIGILGVLLPFAVSLGALIIFQTALRPSISAYYYTGTRDVFVGTLWAIGFFLLSYKGYERADARAGNLGCIFAVGITLFPTGPEFDASGAAKWIGYLHIAFAALFFATLIYFSLCQFTKTDPQKPPTKKKLLRNMIYRVCGYTMAACILLIAAFYLLRDQAAALESYQPVFWLEAIAIVAFGISWLTKGEAILKDRDDA